MPYDNCGNESHEIPVLTILQKLKARLIAPESLGKEDRQRCIEALLGEGYTIVQIAQLLNKCERTIRRDLDVIRKNNALSPDLELVKKIVGDMVQKAGTHRAHLMRIARADSSSAGEKAQAEFLSWRIEREMIDKLQTLGYLPLKPQEVVSDIYHHEDGDGRSYAQLREEIADIERIAKDSGTLDRATEENIKSLQKEVDKAELLSRVDELSGGKKTDSQAQEGCHGDQESN